MLLNPVFSTSVDPTTKAILELIGGADADQPPIQLAKGVYEITHWSDYILDHDWWLGGARSYDAEYPVLGNVTTFNFPDGKKDFGDFGPYGVCDSYEQVLEQCPELVNDPTRGFFIFLRKVRKADQSPQGGWRWHKWGSYIGAQMPEHEYLYDETYIDEVYTFHVYEVLNKESLQS